MIKGLPPRESTLRRAGRSGLGIFVEELSPEVASLDFLRPVISELRHLLVTESARIDTTMLERASRLSDLDIWAVPASATDLSMIPVRSFAGSAHMNWASLRRSTTLRKLYLERGNFSWLNELDKLEEVSLTGMRGDVTLPPPPSGLSTVKKLVLHGPRALSLEHLPEYQRLESLKISGVREVAHAHNIAALRNLKRLLLEDVVSLDSSRWIFPELAIDEVLLVGDADWAISARAQVRRTRRRSTLRLRAGAPKRKGS
ncbi:hypothetical protein [Oerskovia flava]|uniref:hypothetical protein n=1 Tax=Oerskovia flava TaxID=2986422 RepID=UPI00223FAC65|nr:hypothetical protein [Oerskovia sp. JB1-3-2]